MFTPLPELSPYPSLKFPSYGNPSYPERRWERCPRPPVQQLLLAKKTTSRRQSKRVDRAVLCGASSLFISPLPPGWPRCPRRLFPPSPCPGCGRGLWQLGCEVSCASPRRGLLSIHIHLRLLPLAAADNC